MSATNETGHNKNVANFSSAFQIFEEMGPLYNPTNPNLKLDKLAPMKVALVTAMETLDQKKPLYKNAVAERELAMATLSKLMTRSLSLAKSLDLSPAVKENLISLVKKIRGDAKSKAKDASNLETKSNSTSQMSYDSRLANLASYTSQLASLANYEPNDPEISIQAFKDFHQRVLNLNTVVNKTANELLTARRNRDQLLYLDKLCAIQQIKDSKNYLKSLGDPGKPYYNALLKLKFKSVPK